MDGFASPDCGRYPEKLIRRGTLMPISFEKARAIAEASFHPLACTIQQESDSVNMRIFDAQTDTTQLFVTGIPLRMFDSMRSVSQLILEVRQELSITTHGKSRDCGAA
jgi:hypothetical protein